MLDAPSLQRCIALSTLEQDELYMDAHRRDGVNYALTVFPMGRFFLVIPLRICVLVTAIWSAYASLASFQSQRDESDRGRRIFICQIVHIFACTRIARMEVIKCWLDVS